MSNESTYLANCSHSKSSHLAIKQQQVLIEEDKKKEEDNKLLKSDVEGMKERNKVVNDRQLYHCHLHQQVMIIRLEENNKELQHKGDMNRG